MDELHRHSIRLPGYDYSAAGGYYVTIVAFRRECLFGDVVDGEMRLNELGMIVQECWDEIPNHFPNAGIDAFVVMPNHVHGIIMLYDGRGTIYRAPTPAIEKYGKPTVGSLPTIVRTFKAAVTRRAGRELNSANIWQRNYGACPERSEGNTSSATKPITNASPDTSSPTRSIGTRMMKTQFSR